MGFNRLTSGVYDCLSTAPRKCARILEHNVHGLPEGGRKSDVEVPNCKRGSFGVCFGIPNKVVLANQLLHVPYAHLLQKIVSFSRADRTGSLPQVYGRVV